MKLLNSSQALISLIGGNKIISAYPQEVTVFPCIIFEDVDSRDVAFSDNLPEGTAAQVRIHIFSKSIKGYPKTEDIADIIRMLFRADYWAMTSCTETSEVEDNVKHRVMGFRREFYTL
jgi:hypothetical protein